MIKFTWIFNRLFHRFWICKFKIKSTSLLTLKSPNMVGKYLWNPEKNEISTHREPRRNYYFFLSIDDLYTKFYQSSYRYATRIWYLLSTWPTADKISFRCEISGEKRLSIILLSIFSSDNDFLRKYFIGFSLHRILMSVKYANTDH